MVTPIRPLEGCCKKASFAGGSDAVMVRAEAATELAEPDRTAIAFIVDDTLIEIGPL
jgi:hypothetical protein